MAPRSSEKHAAKTLTINNELIVIILVIVITGFIFLFITNQRPFLNFFYIPTLLGAYFFGKRYAVLSAFLSILIVFFIAYTSSDTFVIPPFSELYRWLDIATWGGLLLITSYWMGMLYEKKQEALEEIKKTYLGIIEMLTLVIDSVDKQTSNHSHRVSRISALIAKEMGCDDEEVENIRIAALLHDLGKIGVSSEILHKIGKLSEPEREQMKKHASHGSDLLKPLGSRVLYILPFILYHHERYDGKGYHSASDKEIPLGARIIAVADVYDALTSDRPYRTPASSIEGKNEIIAGSGQHFDPKVVEAFSALFLDIERIYEHAHTDKNL